MPAVLWSENRHLHCLPYSTNLACMTKTPQQRNTISGSPFPETLPSERESMKEKSSRNIQKYPFPPPHKPQKLRNIRVFKST